MATTSGDERPYPLACASVLRVTAQWCEVWTWQQVDRVPFAPVFPGPRTDRVHPGHLVAFAAAADGRQAIVWRWFDAVLLSPADHGRVTIWEPGHGAAEAELRSPTRPVEPGTRAYASSGLPGANWWVAGPGVSSPEVADVELQAVAALYTDNGLWASVFGH